jgi:hypothetical protein
MGEIMKKYFHSFRAYYNIVRKDIRVGFPISFFKKIQLWRRGFLAEKYVLYDFKNHNVKEYLSDHNSSMARWINDPYTDILSNKFLFQRIAGQYIDVPSTYALITDGFLVPTEASPILDNWEHLLEFCREIPVILKPVCGGGGSGIMLVKYGKDGFFCNGISISPEEMINRFRQLNNYLISEYIEQGSFPKNLNPSTTNTMRIVTLIDTDTCEPFIARAVQRIGNKTSAPHDNFTRGGLSSLIDMANGTLGPGATHPKGPQLQWHDVHPDNGNRISGQQIPGWEEVKSNLLNAAGKMPYLKCIGWDILLTDKGIKAIEGNHHPDPDVLQCHGGLLLDNRIRNFYERHNILLKR